MLDSVTKEWLRNFRRQGEMAASIGSDFKIKGTRPPSQNSKAQTTKDKETLLQGTNDHEEASGKMENGNTISHIFWSA